MSIIDEEIARLDEEIVDMQTAEARAKELGARPGDYDLSQAASGAKNERLKQAALQEQAMVQRQIQQQQARLDPNTPQVIPGSTSTYTEDGNTLNVIQADLNDPVTPIAKNAPKVMVGGQLASTPTATPTPEQPGSEYTNVDPVAYELALSNAGVSTKHAPGTPEFNRVYAETISSGKGLMNSDIEEYYSQTSENGRIKGKLDMNDPKVQKEVEESPSVMAWKMKYPKADFTEFKVVEEDDEYKGRKIRTIAPIVTQENIKQNIPEYDPKNYPGDLDPRSSYEHDIKRRFGKNVSAEMIEELGVDMTRYKIRRPKKKRI